jgi:hypothetical protein
MTRNSLHILPCVGECGATERCDQKAARYLCGICLLAGHSFPVARQTELPLSNSQPTEAAK